MKLNLILLGIQFLFFSSPSAQAYPELARHGYVNCQSCHISPNGGGLLNDYGRELSKELLAIWKSDSETNHEHHSAYGLLTDTPLQKWLRLGGDTRSLYLYQNDQFAKLGKTMLMQGQLEAAVDVGQGRGHFTVVGTLDFEEDRDVFSRRHYLLYGIADGLQVRAGKFIPAYGINTADHVSLTRSGIRMGPMYESYNAEISYYPTEKTEIFLTGIFGRELRKDGSGPPSESGGALQVAYSLNESVKLGANVLRGSDLTRKRWLYGPYGIVGITPWMMAMTEVDFQSQELASSPNATRFGVLTTQKLSFEPTEGVWAYLIQEYGKTNFKSAITQSQVYGLGVQIFPRAHFEFNLTWEKIRIDSFSKNFYDYFWFVGHFYL